MTNALDNSGFVAVNVITGFYYIWSAPNPAEGCFSSSGYRYILTETPFLEKFT